MAKMLLRTRKSRLTLGLKVTTLIIVTFSYSLVAYLSTVEFQKQSSELNFFDKEEAVGRHLLGVPAEDINCTPAAIEEFPSDGFTRDQRQNGWIFLHVIVVCYLFALLAVVCDDYFVPAISKFCDCLQMTEDVAGATLMATASSSPELFINCIGTFITEGDIGVGAIVGSAVFNILAVPACCGIFANMVVHLDWWPLSRDSIMYGTAVILLISFLQDGKIYFSEALILISVYALYILVMLFNGPLMRLTHRLVRRFQCKKFSYTELLNEKQPLIGKDVEYAMVNDNIRDILETTFTLRDCEKLEESTRIWEWPKDSSVKEKIWWVLTWPISLVLYTTIPDCRKYPNLYILTFLMCILWIGVASYIISWFITTIGDTLNIPDSVMGLTFLAAGMSVPEAVSSIIVTNQGHGSMGLSSSIGSNTFDILLCLGLPWLIKATYGTENGTGWVKINSAGMNYCAISLLSTLLLLYFTIAFNKFRLDWKVGLTCLLMYVAFLITASLIELNMFVQVNPPTCQR